MSVLVLDKRKCPLMPCTEKRARLLLERGKAVVLRVYPFTIRLKDRVGGDMQSIRVKIDPGSKTTGIALVRETQTICKDTGEVNTKAAVLLLFELQHRGQAIRDALNQRLGFRRRRRAQLRYRPARFLNRTRPQGWLAPSLQHRVDTTMAWVNRFARFAPVTAISQELVRFDTQLMQNPEISGVAYQQGELAGFEVKEYLLEKWGRCCVYCDTPNVPLEVEHIVARANGGTNRVGNLTLSCHDCNQRKGIIPVAQFLENAPARLARVQAQARTPLKDAAAVNSTRWALFQSLKATGLPVETGTGGRTKWNRTRLGISKGHALDAACVGMVDDVQDWNRPVLGIKATGRGSYKRTRLNKHGFPRGYLMRQKQVKGFQTGDAVRATVPKGTKMGVHVGRVAVRASGSFNIQMPNGVVQGISHRHCALIQRADGYGYFVQQKIALDHKEDAGQAA
ncbi:RNA-guided endonuclease IscB [Halothiobacillus sp.]|uniref:RNA-guided endonuclease IscB n=1 Tax=Halothiobacillus sp. TaxID=1891311 RepID=UPI002AD41702|nr:RNA-guided endonuclease IscB [Halothiobacillus sp.]